MLLALHLLPRPLLPEVLTLIGGRLFLGDTIWTGEAEVGAKRGHRLQKQRLISQQLSNGERKMNQGGLPD